MHWGGPTRTHEVSGANPRARGESPALELRSTAFGWGEMIPTEHRCDGDDVSPSLFWAGVREGAGSLTLILEDIDSVKGVCSDWVLSNVPPELNMLAKGVPPSRTLPWGGIQGGNDFYGLATGGRARPTGRRFAPSFACSPSRVRSPLNLAPHATRFLSGLRKECLRKRH